MSTFGKRLSELREARGLSRADLARLADVSQTAVYNWEENDTHPRESTLARICRALGTTEEYLIEGVIAEGHIPTRGVDQVLAEAKEYVARELRISSDKLRLVISFEV